MFRFALLVSVLFFSSCVLKSPQSDNVQTNVTVVLLPPVEITNEVTILQPIVLTQSGNFVATVTLTNSNFSISGQVYLTNILNESLVQPTFSISGYMDASLEPYIESFSVTANSNEFYPVSLHQNLWEVTLFDQTNAYLPLEIEAMFSGGAVRILLNVNITNIPFVTLPSTNTTLLTNVANMEWTGSASIADLNGETIDKAMIVAVDENSNKQIIPCSISNIIGWTNGIKSYIWQANLPLSHGDNTVSGYVLSSTGLSNSIPTVVITRSLLSIDGLKDSTWNNAFLAGTSSNAGYAGHHLNELLITNDSQNLFVYAGIAHLPALTSDYNGPRLSVSINTVSNAGLTNDAWGGNFVFDGNILPDVQLQCRITKSGGQAVYMANSSNWVNTANNWGSLGMNGVKMSVQTNGGFEFSVPLSLLNLQFGQSIQIIATLSGEDSDNANKQVLDVIPENISNQTATNENDFDSVLRVFSPVYVIQ